MALNWVLLFGLTLVGWFIFSHNIYLSISFITTIYNGVFSNQKKKKKKNDGPVKTEFQN
jgi:hypothetical protein